MAKTKTKGIEELYEWLDKNKIQYNKIDSEVIDIVGFGKAFFQDTTVALYKSIFRKDKDGELQFNYTELIEVLLNEGVDYVVFKFGDNFYYSDPNKDFGALDILKYVGTRTEPKSQIKFVNLGVHTPFELLNGSFMPTMWVKKAKHLGHTALGLCDRNTMAGCYQFEKDCKKAGIKHIFGYSLTVDCGDFKFDAKVYVQSQKGLRNLLRIQKAIMVDNVEKKMIDFEELLNRGNGNVLVIGTLDSSVIKNELVCSRLRESFDKIFYQVDLSEYKADRIDKEILEATKFYFDNIYKRPSAPAPILISDCYYLDQDDAKNKIILNKIAEGAAHRQSNQQYYKDIDEHYEIFKQTFSDNWDVDEIFKECCDNTLLIAEGANATMMASKNFMPKYDMTEEERQKYGTVHNMFNQLLEEGLQKLAPKDKLEQYRKQMEYEKYIIESTDNVDYLLVQYDTCNWARRNGILVGCGRGSAAGCLLLYLLGITLIDPIKYDLIFERFLLPERAGLSPFETTIIGEDCDSRDYFELQLETGKVIKIDRDAELLVRRDGYDEPIKCYADELQEGDYIIFDNRDLIFTLNEI